MTTDQAEDALIRAIGDLCETPDSQDAAAWTLSAIADVITAVRTERDTQTQAWYADEVSKARNELAEARQESVNLGQKMAPWLRVE